MAITIKELLVIGGSALGAAGIIFGGSWLVGKHRDSKKAKAEAEEAEPKKTETSEEEQSEEN